MKIVCTQERVVSWWITARRSRAETAVAVRRLRTVSGATACRDMSVRRAAMTSTNAPVGRAKMAAPASTPSAVTGKQTVFFSLATGYRMAMTSFANNVLSTPSCVATDSSVQSVLEISYGHFSMPHDLNLSVVVGQGLTIREYLKNRNMTCSTMKD